MKCASSRPFSDPEAAARKLLEIANATEASQEGRIHIEKINGPILFKEGGSPAEYTARSRTRHREGLAMAARVRDLCEVHPGRGGAVRLMRPLAIFLAIDLR
jgi:hypothetical protein